MIYNNTMTEEQFYFQEIMRFLDSSKRKMMVDAERYFDGKQDILKRERQSIGKDGKLETIANVPNNRIVDNQFQRMVSQKTDYLFSQPLSIQAETPEYQEALADYFDRRFQLKLQKVGREAMLGGICYIYVYYDEDGQLDFDVFNPYEIIPYWTDSMHTKMNTAVRVFDVETYVGESPEMVTKAEIFTKDGIRRFDVGETALIPDMDLPISAYIVETDEDSNEKTEYAWERFPIIEFKYNDREIPLLAMVKSLQDAINTITSDFQNSMEEDVHNSVIVLKNYGGQDLGEFRHNLAAYGAVKVSTVDGVEGGVETLSIDVNASNYQAILQILKRALIENAHGYDAKDDRMSGTPNEMNIRSMYSDLDLDANGMELQFQASFDKLLWFINQDLINKGKGDFTGQKVEFRFNRNILMNDSEQINNVKNSVGIISTETALMHHPYVSDPKEEMERLEEEKQHNLDTFGFGVTAPRSQSDNGEDDGDQDNGDQPDDGESDE